MIYLPNLPTANPEDCLEELRRMSEQGARAVEVGMFDLGVPLTDLVWEPVWVEAENRGILLCSHTGRPAGTPFQSQNRGLAHATHSTSPFVAALPVAQMVFTGFLSGIQV